MPRRTAFCKSSILVVTPIASRCLVRLGVTAPSAPTTIGTIFVLTFQSRATSLHRSWYFILILLLLLLLLLLYYYYYYYYYYDHHHHQGHSQGGFGVLVTPPL